MSPPDPTQPARHPPGLALLGTSADPPTAGHRALLAGLADSYGRVATWASDNPLKRHGASLEQRARLLGLLVQELADPRIRLQQELSSPRALETLNRAARLWPEQDLVFVVGSDLLEQLPRWYRADELLQSCRLAVVPRRGFTLDPQALEVLRRLGGHPELLDLPVPATASSAVRSRQTAEQVPPAVWTELVEHNLYGFGQPSAGPSR
jgi:nicotinate-nucleotide adenylyltransferase